MLLDHLPPELMAEILCRFPVKFLLQIRRVSKCWRTFIDSQFFIRTHLCRSIQTRRNHFHIFLSRDDVKSVDIDLLESAVDLHVPLDRQRSQEYKHKMLFTYGIHKQKKSKYSELPEPKQIIVTRWQGWGSWLAHQIRVWGTCNGLVLMTTPFSTCLWNPSTRKHLTLPELVQPFVSERLYGFGYDSASDDYKAISILKCENQKNTCKEYQVWVYSLQSYSWRKVAKSFPPNAECERQPGVLVCEALHWPVKVKSEVDNEVRDFILAFDLNTQEDRMYSQPKCQNSRFYSRPGALNGSLCLIYSYLPVGFEIWVMVDYGVDESWTRTTLQQEDFISYPGWFTKTSVGNEKHIRWIRKFYAGEVRQNIKIPCDFGINHTSLTDACIVSLVSLGVGAANDQQNEGVN